MPGCGKSSVAEALAAQAGCFWFDLDQTIMMDQGREISEIFATEGEAGFRTLEFDTLEGIVEDYKDFPVSGVLALGGGTLCTPQCADLVKKNFTCIYLKASAEEIVSNLLITGISGRPLLADCLEPSGEINREKLTQTINSLLSERDPIYSRYSSVILNIDGKTPEQIASLIIEQGLTE